MKKSKVLSLLLCYGFEREFKKFSNKFTIKIDNNEYPDYIFYFIDDNCFVEYNLKSGYLWCNYFDFWKYFEKKFNFNYKQVKYSIKYVVEEDFKSNEVTLSINQYESRIIVEEHFNNKI